MIYRPAPQKSKNLKKFVCKDGRIGDSENWDRFVMVLTTLNET